MNILNWLNKWNIKGIKLNAQFVEVELNFNDTDKKAAWDMYVELLTRITTQPLDAESGDEKTALNSIFSLFGTTREILKSNGRECGQFTKGSSVILNQVIRPFTAKWHKKSIEGAFDDPASCTEFRTELAELQIQLKNYTGLLSEIAGVEDLSSLESPS